MLDRTNVRSYTIVIRDNNVTPMIYGECEFKQEVTL